MDKQELLEEINREKYGFADGTSFKDGIDYCQYLVDEWLDEPEITTEQAWEKIAEKYDKSIANVEADFEDWMNSGKPQMTEKPEIPKFVADWIEKLKPYYSLISIIAHYKDAFIVPEQVEDWIAYNEKDFVKALVNGYTIEKPAWVVKNGKKYLSELNINHETQFSPLDMFPPLKFKTKENAEAARTLCLDSFQRCEVEEWSE